MSNQLTIVYAEATPNPASMKFVANRLIIEPEKAVEYLHESEASGSPLAQELFKGGYVKSLYFYNNFVTITKSESADWNKITAAVREFLQDYYTKGLPVIEQYPEPTLNKIDQAAASDLSPGSIEASIHGILEEYIKPAVEQDGGAIRFKSYHDGVVTVALQGSCSGCPSASVTLKTGIENLLVRMVPGVREVVAEEL